MIDATDLWVEKWRSIFRLGGERAVGACCYMRIAISEHIPMDII
jgi:hypothetical protein